jgi:ABC-2 type transport system permease protein
MNPITTIAKLEWRRAWAGRKMLLASISLTLLTALTSLDGVRRTNETRRDKQEATNAMRQFWLGQGQANPHGAAHFGTYVFQSTPKLAFFEPGLLPVLPTSTFLEAHKQNFFHFRPTQDEAPGRFLTMSPAGLLQALLPLWAILFAYDSVTGERARGTLAQLFASSLSGRHILLGKLLGILKVLGVMALPAVIVPMLIGVAFAGIGSGETITFLWIVLLYVLGMLVWTAVSVIVSSMSRSSRTALGVLLAIWVGHTVLVPRISQATMDFFEPLPSLQTFETHMADGLRAGADGHGSGNARVDALKREVLAKHGVSKVEDLPINFDGIAMQAGEEDGNIVFDRHFGALFDTIERREKWALWFGVLSPMELLRPASMALASTDFTHHRRFVASSEQYRRYLVKNMNQVMTERSKTGDWSFTVGDDVWQQIQPFEPPAEKARPIVAAHLGLWAWLTAALVALLIAARKVVPQ